jgi:transposase
MIVHPTACRFIGCDVGKTTLVFGELGQSATHEIANCRANIEAFATRLNADCLFVYEATGGHEALLIDLLASAGSAGFEQPALRQIRCGSHLTCS